MRRGTVVTMANREPDPNNPTHVLLGRRRAVVVQGDRCTHFIVGGKLYPITLVVCVPLTTKLKAKGWPGAFEIAPSEENGLDAPSIANPTQIVSVDLRDIIREHGELSRADMARMDAALAFALGLPLPPEQAEQVPIDLR